MKGAARMCDDDHDHDDKPASWLGQLGDLFTNVDYQLGQITAQEHENGETMRRLVEQLDRAIFVRTRPADRFTAGYLAAVPVDVPRQIIGKNLARASLAIKNLSATTTDVVWVAADQASAYNKGASAFPIYGGGSLVLDTTAEVWVFATTGSTPAIGWVSTEYDTDRA